MADLVVDEAVHERNIEAGVLLDDPLFARALRTQFESRIEWAYVRRVPGLAVMLPAPAAPPSSGAPRTDPPRNGDAGVIVPFDSTFADYQEALLRAARQIARFEGREPADVMADLGMPRVESSLHGAFEELGRALRPPAAPVDDAYVGRVLELSGDVNDAGRLEGDVVLRLDADDELIRARCTLGPDAYMKAHDAHGRQRHVSVRGKLVQAASTRSWIRKT